MPLEGKIHLPGLNNPCFHPAVEEGIKSSSETFNNSVATFVRVATELKQSAQTQGASAEGADIDEQLNEILSCKAHFRNLYEDVLSYTSSWHPGQGSQGMYSSSRAESQYSRASVHTSASEVEWKEKLEAQKRAHQLAVKLYAEEARSVYLEKAREEEKNASLIAEKVNRLMRQAEIAGKMAALEKETELIATLSQDILEGGSLNRSHSYPPDVPPNQGNEEPWDKAPPDVTLPQATQNGNSSDTRWSSQSRDLAEGSSKVPDHFQPNIDLFPPNQRLSPQLGNLRLNQITTTNHDLFIVCTVASVTSMSLPLVTSPQAAGSHSCPPSRTGIINPSGMTLSMSLREVRKGVTLSPPNPRTEKNRRIITLKAFSRAWLFGSWNEPIYTTSGELLSTS